MGLTSRERISRTLRFEGVDRPGRDIWLLPAAFYGREESLKTILRQYPSDFAVSYTHLDVYKRQALKPWRKQLGS